MDAYDAALSEYEWKHCNPAPAGHTAELFINVIEMMERLLKAKENSSKTLFILICHTAHSHVESWAECSEMSWAYLHDTDLEAAQSVYYFYC